MKRLCEDYYLPHSVEEALGFLSAAHGSARILSGGSDLLLELQQGIHPPVRTLVDVTEIAECVCWRSVKDRCSLVPLSPSPGW